MNLDAKIAVWDGKSKDDIEAIFQSEHHSPGFINTLIQLAANAKLSKGSTWLLKHHTDQKGIFEPDQVSRLYSLCDLLTDWQSKLHLLQMIAVMPVQHADKTKLEYFLRRCLDDDNKFVRAWAYNGLYWLAETYSEYREEVTSFFELAMHDEPASVKARVRKLLVKGF